MHTMSPKTRNRFAATALVAALATGLMQAPAQAAGPYERGPAPTVASIEAARGSFATG